MFEAEGSFAGLVEWSDERDIEAGDFVAYAQVDAGFGPGVGGFKNQGAAVEGP